MTSCPTSDCRSPVLRLRGGATSASPSNDAPDPAPIKADSESVHSRDDGSSDDSDDDDDEGFDDEDEVELGLVRPMPSDWDIDYAVGKVGGKPVWLDPKSPLTVHDVTCRVCRATMTMLLQVNSPDDSRPHAAARSLYVYTCRTPSCVSTDAQKSIRIWRTQMSSPNEWFPHTEASLAERKRIEATLDERTALSGTLTPTTNKTTVATPWPEFDIAAEPEPYEESYLPDPDAPAPEQDEAGGEDAEAGDTVSGVDKEFLAFQERIEREPAQVLRFYRLPGVDNPEPLWASKRKVQASEVPLCDLCRVPRQVEFQILSTLLSHLSDDSLDFDSLLVYTCSDNCRIPSRPDDQTGWAEEVVFKQDFTSSGVKFGQR